MTDARSLALLIPVFRSLSRAKVGSKSSSPHATKSISKEKKNESLIYFFIV
jgi:hypothetical protein